MNKLEFINNTKKEISDHIKITIDKINNNNKETKQLINIYDRFLNFIKKTTIFEIMKWTDIKTNYNNLKKTITKDKKLLNKIIRLYSSIINYYDPKEIVKMNDTIKLLSDDNKLMIVNLRYLSMKHKQASIQCNTYFNNIKIIKINKTNEILQSYLLVLNSLYEDNIKINNNIKKIKSLKISLLI